MKTITLFIYMFVTSITDIRHKKIPIGLLFIFCTIAIFINAIEGFNYIDFTSFIPGLLMLIISFISSFSLSLGDSIFILSLGLILSHNEIFFLLFLSLFFISFAGLFMYLKTKNRKLKLPFIPFIFLAYLLLLLT